MPKTIQILPNHVVQQIAAGEVVERPASIIKELLENSIDAGATAIDIVIRQGGIDGIEITDNGHGIDKDQLQLALTAHATSKLSEESDLHHIQTRGFRGEALASIAAISHLNLHSKPQEQEHGFMIASKGGELSQIQPSALPNGTKINIAHLFYNTPARKKFLKSPNSEKNHIIAQIKKIALVEYGISFKIFIADQGQQKLLYHWPAQDNWLQRIETIFPGDVKDKLLPVHNHQHQHLSIQGYISNRHLSFSRSSEIYFYVNHRPVSDKTLQAALMEGYRTAMMEKRYPMAIVKIDIDPQWVDVNIHPRKNEVRFSNPQQIFQELAFVIKQSLNQQKTSDAQLTATSFFNNTVSQQNFVPAYASQQKSVPGSTSSYGLSSPVGANFSQPFISSFAEPSLPYTADVLENPNAYFSQFNFIGHIDHTYLLCSNHQKLIIVDQHAAHERILFDQYKQQFSKASHLQKGQQLLNPINLNFSPEKTEVLTENLETFCQLGFDLEAFGPQSFILRSTPSFLIKQDAKVYIENVCNDLLSNHQTTQGLEDPIDHICSSMACHSAVRAHDILSPKEVDYLLRSMDGVDLASYCPHGRPTYIEYQVSDFEKLFKRV
ncbi:MAG TPA: DNA mismatch repair endonuclease MutL [Oligoflexia bacterium]|nr:DNA mismatch repair endonuclease MutL [Oligoflexia bacterium]HMR25373.1 DNA mismatch repair endonuclease MutL [Oligoflexia bacterium]